MGLLHKTYEVATTLQQSFLLCNKTVDMGLLHKTS